MSEHRHITDARAMRAMAHPTRLALLDLLRRDGELTATRAAELLDESPGNMSWHLQTLAKYGFVEEAGGGKGRSRPWRIASARNRFDVDPADPATAVALDELTLQMLERGRQLQHEWFSARQSYPAAWRDAAFLTHSLVYLTAEELTELSNRVIDLFAEHFDRSDPDKRPEGALPVHLTAYGHPLPPTAAGN
jgi:DNA-binding transcriptional ArsR family regulator